MVAMVDLITGTGSNDEPATARLSPHLAPLWNALHRRLSSGRRVRQVRIGPLDAAQRSAVADLLGLDRLPGEYETVQLAAVDKALHAAIGYDVATALEHLVGPISNRAELRAAAAAERNMLWEWLSGHEVVQEQPALASWAEAMRRNGVVAGSVRRTRTELERALRVLAVLPGAGVQLPVLAEHILEDPHALDDGTRVQGMVVRALCALYDVPPPENSIGLRRIWARAGVSDDELSSTVLVAGRPITGVHVAGHIVAACAEAGLAAVLSLQQLRASDPVGDIAEKVWVVENPSVLATALARFGPACPPMICVSGWPSSAAVVLLDQLATAGTTLHYHGDLDGEGLRIAANLVSRFGAVPWRMTCTDYLAALGADGPGAGRVTPVPWDAELADQMVRHGRAVPQERLIDTLLADIAP